MLARANRSSTETRCGAGVDPRAAVRLLLCFGLWLLASCQASPRPNIVLITLDTTRWDHLGCYGYTQPTSPNLDRFAATATVFEHAYATSSWTLPSHASLFTGLLPLQHGAQTTVDGPVKRLGYGVRPLAERFVTLAELLHGVGYRTAAVVAGPALSRELGVAQGFEHYDDALDGPDEKVTGKRADVVASRAIGHLESFDAAPYFLFVNFFDPHAPYRPPPPDDGDLPVVDQGPLVQAFVARLTAGTAAVPPARLPPSERRVLDGLRAGYDAEIRYMDRHLGRLLQAIEASPRANETLVVITADHGESFGEHYFVSHGAHLYEDNVRVPLVMRGAGVGHGPGTRIAPAVQNHRVFASILDAVDLELPPGVVLAPLGAPGGVVVTEVKRSESNILFGAFFDRDLRTILVPPLKLIESTAAAPELFHIEHDPAELADLAAVRAADVRVLAARLEEIARLHPPLYDAEARAVLEPDTEDALRALGYIE